MKAISIVLGVSVLLLMGCGGNATSNNSATQLTVDEGVVIPADYTLVEASAYGQYANNNTLYIRNKSNGRVYEYEDGKLGTEIVVQEGYALVAVSAYGKFANKRTFYCQKNGTDQVFLCSPK